MERDKELSMLDNSFVRYMGRVQELDAGAEFMAISKEPFTELDALKATVTEVKEMIADGYNGPIKEELNSFLDEMNEDISKFVSDSVIFDFTVEKSADSESAFKNMLKKLVTHGITVSPDHEDYQPTGDVTTLKFTGNLEVIREILHLEDDDEEWTDALKRYNDH